MDQFSKEGAVDVPVKTRYTTSLREWLLKDGGFNLALVPQFNNEYTVFGVLEALRDENLLKSVQGISTVSGTTLPGAYLAAGKSFNEFNGDFPAKGWGGFGPGEPNIDKDYREFLSKSLPNSFEELQVPLTVSLTHWDDETAVHTMDNKKARSIIANSGDLPGAMVAAVASGKNHPITNHLGGFGFYPKRWRQNYPVTDGGLTDAWALKGLKLLPKSSRVLHILSLDYDDQWKPREPKDIPTNPQELLTLTTIQPPTASHSFRFENSIVKGVTKRSAEEWNKIMFSRNYNATKVLLDQPLEMQPHEQSFAGVIKANSRIDEIETPSEKAYDMWTSKWRDAFWSKWMSEAIDPDMNK